MPVWLIILLCIIGTIWLSGGALAIHDGIRHHVLSPDSPILGGPLLVGGWLSYWLCWREIKEVKRFEAK